MMTELMLEAVEAFQLVEYDVGTSAFSGGLVEPWQTLAI